MTPRDRHGAPVSFEEEKGARRVAVCVGILNGEHAVGDDAKLQAAVHLHMPLERWALCASGLWQGQILIHEELEATFPTGHFHRHHHLGHEQGVFQKQPSHGSVLGTPPDTMSALQEGRTSVS